VQAPAGDRFDGALQFGQREFTRHQFEHHRAIFELGAQPRDRGREDAAVVEPHRLAQRRQAFPRQRGFASVAARFLDQPGLVEQFIAVEHALFVPRAAAGAECEAQPFAPPECVRRLRPAAVGPFFEQRQDGLVEDRRARLAPVLPWEETVPWLEASAGNAQRVVGHAGEGEISDRDHVSAGVAGVRVAATVTKGVELLHIADRQAGLRLDPGAQPDLEGAVCERVERSEWQPRALFVLCAAGFTGGQDGRLLVLHRHDRGGEADLDRGEGRVGHLAIRHMAIRHGTIIANMIAGA